MVPHIPLVLSNIVIYIQTSCALTLSYPAVGKGKLQARSVPITLEGEDGRIQMIAPPCDIRIEEVVCRERGA